MAAAFVRALLTLSGATRQWLTHVGMVCVLLLWSQQWAVTSVHGQTVVDGVGVIVRENQAAARTRAIREALRKAIEQVVVEQLAVGMVVEQRQALEIHVYARPERFVRSYRVLWEYPDIAQKVYRVGIEVDVASEDIAQAMSPVEEVSKETPRVAPSGDEARLILLQFVENQLEQVGLGVFGRVHGIVATGLRTQLQAQGLRIVTTDASTPWDGQEHSALMAARALGASVVLIGRADVERIRSDVAGVALQAVEASVQMQAVVVQSGERLALEQLQTTALHTDAVMASKHALEKAATALAARLVLSLQAYAQPPRDMSRPSAIRAGQ